MSFQHPTSVTEHAGVRQSLAHARVQAFIDAYKRDGYRIADIDPLDSISLPDIAELQPQYHALSDEDVVLSQHRFLDGLGLSSVRDLAHHLGKRYCGPLGVDCSGLRDDSRSQWLLARVAAQDHGGELAGHERAAALTRLVAAEEWERFLQEEYPLGKRFSLEGCESLLLLMESLAERASFYQLEQLFFAMPHRGRLNLLVNFMQMPAAEIVAYFDKQKTTPAAAGAVDLPYHLGYQSVRATAHGQITLLLAHNPSHLESAYPVLLGMVRGAQAQDIHGELPASVVIHGDAAFCGQGVVMESLKLAQHPGYTVGGTVHVIVNNQIGFTTPNPLAPENHGYCTDIARVVGAPVLHVNADQPEMVLRAARIAFDYRMQFQSDVVIDLVGYRRWGHSEQDTSTFTQPLLHGFIEKHPTVTALYEQAAQPGMADGWPGLARARQQARAGFKADAVAPAAHVRSPVQPMRGQRENPGLAQLRHFVDKMTSLPAGFAAHVAIGKLIAQWQASVSAPQAACQWTFAENMAYASLLSQGLAVRISGMDVQRGTFLHRHAVWHAVDVEQGVQREFWPLREVAAEGAALEIINSPLSEEAVVGFEYGFSSQVQAPGLVIWEAQFGDFVNGAQIMIDQYITSGAGKWGYRSGLTMLLPHGYEGVGPEHSTGYLSRMLLLCAQDNIRVAMPSTSAQWFHLLRQQALEGARPLVVFTPKVVLHGEAASHSPLSALVEGDFAPLLADRLALPAAQVRRVVLCSGKVYYDLARGQAEAGDDATAILSVEQLYPFPTASLSQVLAGYPALEEVIWVQEEERNQGAWLCVREAIEASLPATVSLRAVCRDNTASGPTASKSVYYVQQKQLVHAVFPGVTLGREG